MIRTALAAAALAGIFATSTAVAQTTAQDAPTARVHYADLDLSQPAAMKVLRHRVALAVNTVCPLFPAGSMEDMMANSRCRARAMKGANQQIAALLQTRTYAQADASVPSIEP